MTTFTGAITRTELSLGDLAIGTGSPYRVKYDGGLDAGTVNRRRVTVTSPFVEGSVETSSVRDEAVMGLTIFVTGADLATVQTNIAALLAAVSQSSYTLTATIGGTAWAWACRAADYHVAFGMLHNGLQAPVVLSIPRYPVATTGPF